MGVLFTELKFTGWNVLDEDISFKAYDSGEQPFRGV